MFWKRGPRSVSSSASDCEQIRRRHSQHSRLPKGEGPLVFSKAASNAPASIQHTLVAVFRKENSGAPPCSRLLREGGEFNSIRPRRAQNLVLHCLVGDLEAFIDDGKSLPQLLLVDAKRRVRIERVPAH